MKVKFKKSGVFALNYGIDGTMEAEKDQVVDLNQNHALVLVSSGIADIYVDVEAAKKEDVNVVVIDNSSCNAGDADDFEAAKEAAMDKPKKRGRKKKAE